MKTQKKTNLPISKRGPIPQKESKAKVLYQASILLQSITEDNNQY